MTDESLFAAALDRSDPAARGAYLDAACSDHQQRTRVERLLAAHTAATGFLERSAGAPADAAPTKSFDSPPAASGLADTRVADVRPLTAAPDVLALLRPSPRPDALGRLAHYDVLEVVGSGGFGTVLKAFDERLHRVVAVKVLSPQLAASGPARARFVREGRSAAAIRDEHVVGVHAVSGDDEPVPYLVMEFISGPTLQQKLDRVGPLPVKEVLRIGAQVARGLSAAHATGLIHRDIKPANILLENGVERVKITDFGLARAADDASISQSGVVAGTPMYMSPEQARGDTLDTRSDLFSLGSVLYALLTGHPPFRAETVMGVLKRVIEDDPRPIRQTNADAPEWLCRVVEKLLAKSPADRFQTAAEVADLLTDCERQLLAHGTLADAARIPAAKVEPPVRIRKWRRRLLRLGLVVLALGLVGVGAEEGWNLYRFILNRNEIRFDSASGLESITVYSEDGKRVHHFRSVYEGDFAHFQLPPGQYRIEATTKAGRIAEWQVRGEELGQRWTSGTSGWFRVPRGAAIQIRTIVKDAPTAPPELAEVLVAARDLPVGTTFTADALKTDVKGKKVPKNALPPRALTDPAALAGRQLARAIRAGEPFDLQGLERPIVLPEGYGLAALTIDAGQKDNRLVVPNKRVNVRALVRVDGRVMAFKLLDNVLVVNVEREAIRKLEGDSDRFDLALTGREVMALALAQTRKCVLTVQLRDPEAGPDKDYDVGDVIKLLEGLPALGLVIAPPPRPKP